MLTGKNYIGFDLSAESSEFFHTFNPANNSENSWKIWGASGSEIERALEKAHMVSTEFGTMNDRKRAAFLETIAEEMSAIRTEILDTYVKESGLSPARADVEMKRTLHQLHSFAEFITSGNWRKVSIDEGIPDRKPLPKPDLRKTLVPLGPVVVFGASNFPLAYSTMGGDSVSALAAGCPVIVKAHPMHAGTGELVASAVIKAAIKTKMPDGVFSNLNSSGFDLGRKLVQDRRVRAVGFTGSHQGGRALFDLANQRKEPIPVFAEMGSVNPVIISAGSLKTDYLLWANKYADSITQGSGQFCTKPGLLFALDCAEVKLFARVLADKMDEINQGPMLHPEIRGKFEKAREKVVSDGNVKVLTKSVMVSDGMYGNKAVLLVKDNDFINNPDLHREAFGPLAIVVVCCDINNLEQIIAQMEGQLTGTLIVMKDEFDQYREIVDALKRKVGRLIFNGVPTGVEVCPSMNHGGPYPATTDARFTAVGIHSIYRWLRPVSYQNFPPELLPDELL